MRLESLLRRGAGLWPKARAVAGPDGAFTYAELDRLAEEIATALWRRGVRPGDRVGIWAEKSTRVVAVMQGVLRCGAAYVPVDPMGPVSRALAILSDCAVKAVVTTRERTSESSSLGAAVSFAIEDDVAGWSKPGDGLPELEGRDQDLAYILYTSGSTGKPKGVCISHGNAMAFIEWAAEAISASPEDRFSNHAPMHFDLSVLDVYVPMTSGAFVSLVGESQSLLPRSLTDFIRQHEISVWYSVPSALIMMMNDGDLFTPPPPSLRAVLFAGEPFPMQHLKRLRAGMPGVRLLNLYGPTETNVCTYHEVRELSANQVETVPIGRACSGNRVWAEKADGTFAAVGGEGELVVDGPTVHLGYWGQSPQQGPYRTGDIVRVLEEGLYSYLGRRDQMAKVRGHRVEPGEIEAAIDSHVSIDEVAVLIAGSGLTAKIIAFVVPKGEKPSLIELKRHCSKLLPRHMILDDVSYLAELPRTSNGKVDRIRLRTLCLGPQDR